MSEWWEKTKDSAKLQGLDKYLDTVNDFMHTDLNEDFTGYNFGCGAKTADGPWINIDMEPRVLGVVKGNLTVMGNPDETVDRIMCLHALEHVTIREALKALAVWNIKLKKGGRVLLAVPDLEGILKALMTPNAPYELYWWFRFCLYGYQVNQDIPIDDGNLSVPVNPYELHLCGWTARMLEMDLMKTGFKPLIIERYDGYGTPSMYAIAEK